MHQCLKFILIGVTLYMFRTVLPSNIRSSKLYIQQWRTQEFCSWGGSTNSVEDKGQRERGSGGSRPIVRGSGGSCNLVQEISFHIVKFS